MSYTKEEYLELVNSGVAIGSAVEGYDAGYSAGSKKLAEAQHRINVLEDALRNVFRELGFDSLRQEFDEANNALSTTSPTEALDKVVREAQNEMLDKVAESGLIGKDGELYKSLRRIEP